MHARHISSEKARMIGLRVIDLEKDNNAYMATLENTNAVKIIENQNGIASIVSAST